MSCNVGQLRDFARCGPPGSRRACLTVLDRLPILPAGKIDRVTLPGLAETDAAAKPRKV